LKDILFEVEALDNNLNLVKLSNAECKFSYRNSIFKEENWVVLSAQVQLKLGNKEELRAIADSRIQYRKDKHPLEYPNAGSIFKNVDVKKVPEQFYEEFKDKIKQDPFPIVPAAWFVIGAGLTGTKVGKAQISEKHSNYIVNLGGAAAADVKNLINIVQQKIKEKYGIDMEPEVQFLGF